MTTDTKSVAIIGTRGYPSYYGGFETAVRRLAPYLADHGWKVRVYSRPMQISSNKEHIQEGIESTTTWGVDSRSFSTLSYGASATMHAIVHRPDVALYMNVANGIYLPPMRWMRIPTAINVDGMEWLRGKWGIAARTLFRIGARLSARSGASLIFDSKEIARLWGELFGVAGTFIPYGGDVLPDVPPPTGLSRRGYVLVVARFVPENSIDVFFEAIRRMPASTPVVMIGNSTFGDRLDQTASDMARRRKLFRWIRHVEDDRLLHAYWNNAGVYFHGHTVGGTNPALVQAMASGAPILAVDTAFNHEVLGEDGVFVKPEPKVLAERLTELLSAPATLERMSERGRDRARRLYGWDAVNSRYERLLESLIRKRGSGA